MQGTAPQQRVESEPHLDGPHVDGTVTPITHLKVLPTDDQAAVMALRKPHYMGRLFDVVVALCAILVFLPLLVLITLAIKISAPGPAIYIQQRVGRDGKMFPCLKFRSMVVNSQEILDHLLATCPQARQEWEQDQKLRKDPRITTIGAILRKTSLDELPQLFNILVGHMSVVGPRPITSSEIPRYGPRFDAYCSVRPGLTGLWQVSGRNDVSYSARVNFDVLYTQRKSVLYDFCICLRTIPAVLNSRGVY